MRIVNRLIAFVVALALVGVSLIIIIEVIAERAGSAPLIIHWPAILAWAQRNTWRATSVELASAIVAAAGLLLLVPQLFRRRVSRLRMDVSGTTDAAITRKGVTVTIRGAVAEVDGIASSRVKIGKRRIKVRALTAAASDEVLTELRPRVAETVEHQLEGLHLHKTRRVRVTIDGHAAVRTPSSPSSPTRDAGS